MVRSSLTPYWFYILDGNLRIETTRIIECANDDEAKCRGQVLLAENDGLDAVEIWNRTRRLFRYSKDGADPVLDDGQRPRWDRKSANATRAAVLAARRDAADRLAATIAEDRQAKLRADAEKTARLRAQRLATEAAGAGSRLMPPLSTILLVEDDAPLAYALSKSLRDAHHHVITALDGFAAIKALDRDVRIDVLLTDIVLPSHQPHGFALAKLARRKRPDLAVIFMTGYGELGENLEGDRILLKPVETQTVLNEIAARARTSPLA
jgi:CheY-like chemotaxis protein